MNQTEREELVDIANSLAEVRDWTDIPEETHAGINGILDRLNDVISGNKTTEKISRYKLSSGLWDVLEYPKLESVEEAWEHLRGALPGKYATLYKEVEIEVPIVNAKKTIEAYNRKYATKIESNTHPDSVWVPVLFGVTNYEYDLG